MVPERFAYRCECRCGWRGIRLRAKGEYPCCPRCNRVVANTHGNAPLLAALAGQTEHVKDDL